MIMMGRSSTRVGILSVVALAAVLLSTLTPSRAALALPGAFKAVKHQAELATTKAQDTMENIGALDTDDGSDEDSCTDEVADCEADSECDECNQQLSDSCTEPDWESTEDESFCADVEDYICCQIEDGCSSNDALVDLVECSFESVCPDLVFDCSAAVGLMAVRAVGYAFCAFAILMATTAGYMM